MRKTVGPSGPITSEIVLIGEAPAAKEVEKGEPFVGSAGHFLTLLTRNAGLDRDQLYITNLSKERAPGDKMDNMPLSKVLECTRQLIDEINSLPNVKILVPLGNYAMKAVADRRGITNYRGSVLEPVKEIKHKCLVIPTFHPSKMHYDYECWPLIAFDFDRVRRLKEKGYTYTPPDLKLVLRPSFDTVTTTLQGFLDTKTDLKVLDVETPRGVLSCIGISWSRFDAISIPFINGDGSSYWSIEEEYEIWRLMAEILPQLNLGAHNFLFDWRIMQEHGIKLAIPYYDSMLMHHCLFNTLPHKLDTVTSIYTDISFYKKDEKEEKGSVLKKGKEWDHWEYNAKDCCACQWGCEEMEKELIDENLKSVYENLYVKNYDVIHFMNMYGIKVDMKALKESRDEMTAEMEMLLKELEEAAGHELNPRSTEQIKKFLYEELGMAGYRKRGTDKLTTDQKAMEKLAYKYQTDIPLQISRYRSISRDMSLFKDDNIYPDGRIRCQYSLGRTSTGRLASRKGLGKKGMNLQNIKRGSTRRFFLPDVGHVLLVADQKQADARIVAWLSEDPLMCQIIESGMIHMENAKNLFGDYVDKDDPRYHIAKTLIHAGNYGIGINRYAMEANVSKQEAKLHLELYHKTYPGVRDKFQKDIREEIDRTRMLTNPFGRRYVFISRIDDTAYKAGYAFVPQSTVGDLNKRALSYMHKWYTSLLELHDGIAVSVPEKEVENAITAVQEAYDVEIVIHGIAHKIPIDIAVGDNWGDAQEVKL